MLTRNISQARRRLLKTIGYSLMAVPSGLVFGHAAKAVVTGIDDDQPAPLADSMKAVGEAYLARYPAERSKNVLIAKLRSRADLFRFTTGKSTPTAFNTLIIEDFSTDKVVYLNGWALSRTEARLAALTVV